MLLALLLWPSPAVAEPIGLGTNAALEMRLSDLPEDGVLTWTSPVHLRTAALHEDVAGFAPTGSTATARTLITEVFLDGLYVYRFDVWRLTDRCGRVQFDLEDRPWGILAGGFGFYAVLDLIDNCQAGGLLTAGLSPVAEPVPEPAALALVSCGLCGLLVRRWVTR